MSADHGSPPHLPEPTTPTWLTALGALLFFSAGAWWLATQPSIARAPSSADAGVQTDAGVPPPAAPGH
jgi:hypothetical protein